MQAPSPTDARPIKAGGGREPEPRPCTRTFPSEVKQPSLARVGVLACWRPSPALQREDVMEICLNLNPPLAHQRAAAGITKIIRHKRLICIKMLINLLPPPQPRTGRGAA